MDQRVTEEVESIGLEGCLDEKEVKDECQISGFITWVKCQTDFNASPWNCVGPPHRTTRVDGRRAGKDNGCSHQKSEIKYLSPSFAPLQPPSMVRSHPTYIKLWSFVPDNDSVSGLSSLLTCLNLPSFPSKWAVPISPLMEWPAYLCQPPFIHKDMAHPTSHCSHYGSLLSEPLWLQQSLVPTVRPPHRLSDPFLGLASISKQGAP